MPPRNWIKRFGDVFWDTDLRAIEWGLILLAYWWALALLTPGTAFGRAPYVVLRALIGDGDWAETSLGLTFLAIAVAQTLATRNGWIHQVVIIAAGWLWGVIALSGVLLWPLPAYSGGYLLVATAAAWLVARTNVRKRP